MRFSVSVLIRLSRNPGGSDYAKDKREWNLEDALSLLMEVFPDFLSDIADKQILDFGCGGGFQSVALAKNGARQVLGIDSNPKALAAARDLTRELDLNHKVAFSETLEDRFKGSFDVVISQNSMEHFANPEGVFEQMKYAVRANGRLYITFGPPWYAPYGSHMYFFTKVPWVNILFREKTIMEVRKRFRGDGAMRYEDVVSGLNKMTIARFERMLGNSGMELEYTRYDCVKGFNFLGRIPLGRELFINRVSCVLLNSS